jgi:hypothetical protein
VIIGVMVSLHCTTRLAFVTACAALLGACSLLVDTSPYVGNGQDGGPPRDGGRDAGDGAISPDGPSMPQIALLPDSPRTADALEVTIVGPSVDPLGQSVTYEYRWLRDGTPVDTAGPRIEPDATAKGQTWRVEVTPVAGAEGRRGAPASAEVVIGNTPPTLATVALESYIVILGETIRATPSPAVDADREAAPVTLQWFRNDMPVAGASGPTLATTGFNPGDRIWLEAFASDGTDESERVRVGPIELRPSGTQWRPLAPAGFTNSQLRYVFYDEQHRRHVTYDGQFLWEMRVASGRVRTSAIVTGGVGPAVTDETQYAAYHDVEGRRLLFRFFDDASTLHVLDLRSRGGEAWSTITTGGETPGSYFWSASYYDRANRRLWIHGGVNPRDASMITGNELWSLDLTPGAERWQRRSLPGSLPARFAHLLVPGRTADELLLLGGLVFTGREPMGSTDVYRLTVGASDTAAELINTLPRAALGSSALAQDGRILLAGGQTEFDSGSVPFGVASLDPATGVVTELGTAPEGVLGLLTADPDDPSRALFWRGLGSLEMADATGEGTGFELRAIALATGNVTDVAIERRPPPLSHGGWGGRTAEILIGGQTDAGPHPLVWSYEPGTDQWSVVTTLPDAVTSTSPSPRFGTQFFDSSPWEAVQLFGGQTGSAGLADAEVWELLDRRWLWRTRQAGAVAIAQREGAAYVASGACGADQNYVFGGVDSRGGLLADAWSLVCAVGDRTRECIWESAASGGTAPTARAYATMGVTSASHAYVFGGRTSAGANNQVFGFNTCTGGPATWFSVAPTGTALSPRWAHSMLRLPTRSGELDSFLIFGGTATEAEPAGLDDAAILEMTSTTTARWVPVSPVTPLRPRARHHHQAIWDEGRSRMIVFGGRSAFRPFGDTWELVGVR